MRTVTKIELYILIISFIFVSYSVLATVLIREITVYNCVVTTLLYVLIMLIKMLLLLYTLIGYYYAIIVNQNFVVIILPVKLKPGEYKIEPHEDILLYSLFHYAMQWNLVRVCFW